MTHFGRCFGIVTERGLNRFTIFDTDTLKILHQIPIPGVDLINAIITTDCSHGVITSFNNQKLFQVDLTVEPPQVSDTKSTVPIFAEDVALSPDNRFAVIVDGSIGIISYSLVQKMIIESIHNLPANAVAVSPSGNGLVLTATDTTNSIQMI